MSTFKRTVIMMVVMFFNSNVPVFTESFTLTSYYPSPFGSYERLRLVPQPAMGTPCTTGTLYVNSADNYSLNVCTDADGTPGGEWSKFNPIWTQTGNDIYLTSTPTDPAQDLNVNGTPDIEELKVGVGLDASETSEFKLTLLRDGGIMAKGTFGSGDTLTASGGAGTRFIWYPRKAALRAGRVGGSQWDDSNIGNYSVAFGLDNLAIAQWSTISGGEGNTVEGNFSTIIGGNNNSISAANGPATYNTIVGGQGNNSGISDYHFIGGGNDNSAMVGAPGATVGGGENNNIQMYGSNCTILGGQANLCDHSPYATMGGGRNNTIDNAGTFNGAVLSGGQSNQVTWSAAVINGGLSNLSNGTHTTVGGGRLNTASGNNAVVAGGKGNTATGLQSTILGGEVNTASASYTTILGGKGNSTTGNYSFIGSGVSNEASNGYAVVGTGYTNRANGYKSFIGGGDANRVIGDLGIVEGGYDNKSGASYTWTGGKYMHAHEDRTFVWGHGSAEVNVNAQDSFIIYSGNVGLGINTPSEKLHIGGNLRIDNGSIILTADPPDVPEQPLYHETSTTIVGIIGSDLAEKFVTIEEVGIGDCLVMADDQPLKLQKSRQPYDKRVIGVVSAAPAVVLEGTQQKYLPQPFHFQQGTTPPVALNGRALAKVSIENGPIAIGDILTTASQPGHIMKADNPQKARGAIVGKALQPFSGGPNGEETGNIIILVIP
jgi:hypothetical protein